MCRPLLKAHHHHDGGHRKDSSTIRAAKRYALAVVAVSLLILGFLCSDRLFAETSYSRATQSIDIEGHDNNNGAVLNDHQSLDPCSMEYWKAELAKEDPPLQNLQVQHVGFLYTTFSKNGSTDGKADDKHGQRRRLGEPNATKIFDRMTELNYSVACLEKSLPNIPHSHIDFGDFDSYQSAMASVHSWASSDSPFVGNFVIDTDVFANPSSEVRPEILTWALQNVDLALVYNANRELSKPALQSGGLQGSFIGYRNNKRAQLFHSCVAHTLLNTNTTMRQQQAINTVLESPVGQYLRVRWLPPEFLCWYKEITSLAGFVVEKGVVLHNDTKCLFVHSHGLASRPEEELQACF